MRIVLTAGFDRARHAVAIAELARRAGHTVAAVIVVRALRVRRVKQFVRQRGAGGLVDAARRFVGGAPRETADSEVEALLVQESIAERSLSAWCRRHGVPLRAVADLNAPNTVEFLRALRVDGVVYGGGGILRRPFLEAADGRVLNAHSGPLPDVRGMNACEWALLLGAPPAITIHVIDEGIDTGGVLEVVPIGVERGDTLARLRGKCVVAGVRGLVRALGVLAGPLPRRAPAAASRRQCFTLAPVLRELLEQRLEARGGA